MTDYLDGYDDEELDEIIERQNERKKPKEIDIPIAFQKRSDIELPTEEQLMAQAMLNNIPNNTDIEKQNHLAELGRACQNWDNEEWAVVLVNANIHAMIAEIDRRSEEYEKTISDTRTVFERLASQKL